METNAERRERLLTVFKSIAKNPNNDNATHFSRAELKSTISTKLQRSTTRHTNTVFEKMHTSMDTDDTITFEEFYVFCMSREKKLRKVFVQYDISKTNKITKSDMKYALRNLTNHRVSQSQINSYMKFFDNTYDDAHGDGISYEIFRDSLLLLNVDSLTDISDHYFADCNFNYTMWEPALAGGVAAAVSGTTVAPLERLRMTMITDGTKKYLSSTLTAFRSIKLEEGFRGFWRGNFVNMVRIFPQNAIAFMCYEGISREVEENWGKGVGKKMLASSLSGCICLSAVYPLDLIRGRITTSPGVYRGVGDALGKIIEVEGTQALFKGISHANLWAVVFYGVSFSGYDWLKEKWGENWGKVGPGVGMTLGSLAGMCGTVCAFPIESSRRKLQMQGVFGRPYNYSSMWECLRGVARKEGLRGVYSGLGSNLMKMAPASAITFAVYDDVLARLNDLN